MIIFIIRLKRRFPAESGRLVMVFMVASWMLKAFYLFCDCGGVSIYFFVAMMLIERDCDVNSNRERFEVDVGIVR